MTRRRDCLRHPGLTRQRSAQGPPQARGTRRARSSAPFPVFGMPTGKNKHGAHVPLLWHIGAPVLRSAGGAATHSGPHGCHWALTWPIVIRNGEDPGKVLRKPGHPAVFNNSREPY